MKSARHGHETPPHIEDHERKLSVPAEARIAANDETQQRQREHEPELGPLWVIAIAMAAFFLVTGLVVALG
ncbi:MAG TPA: hypothetical protein VFP37_06640 [Steroidobacteraceae bacterium]|nr:hypothetical protein [Steroidobacteraceae bacterium]